MAASMHRERQHRSGEGHPPTVHPTVVHGELNFHVPNGERPRVYQPTPEHPETRRSGEFELKTLPIADAREHADRLSLDVDGFELHRHDTRVSDFLDDEEVERDYYPEIERLVKDVTGASAVVIFDHTVRIEDRDGTTTQHSARKPVRVVHNDYTLKSGPQRVFDLLDADEARHWSRHRYAEINVWRSIAGPVETTPLAVANAQSLSSEDFIATDLIYPDRTGEIYQVAYNPKQHWHYVSNMTRDEALLLKCFDSDEARARWTAHSAFDNPLARPDAPPRQSIEVRTLISFAP